VPLRGTPRKLVRRDQATCRLNERCFTARRRAHERAGHRSRFLAAAGEQRRAARSRRGQHGRARVAVAGHVGADVLGARTLSAGDPADPRGPAAAIGAQGVDARAIGVAGVELAPIETIPPELAALSRRANPLPGKVGARPAHVTARTAVVRIALRVDARVRAGRTGGAARSRGEGSSRGNGSPRRFRRLAARFVATAADHDEQYEPP